MKLITARTLKQGMAMEESKISQTYQNICATGFLNEKDIAKSDMKEGELIKAKTAYGEVVVKCSKGVIDEGNLLIPMGPWANIIIGGNTNGTGMPDFKGIDVRISKTDEKILDVKEIIQKLKEK
ncbi:MAG: tRNA CCA-pyrophosphorylase [Candidatus Altiarchaeum hamiconexum]|uniref:tRNA CCA-pyrophosphorylase n=1 Tax=Candidatus Altarchaeum hamiconexum TaxID=1803513 RepID=A0A8J8CE55_9ARCH|nr:tRNA CCA-pyrophosphorylase [Candidatus Altarchaeum hamiconexum]PIN67803.1 MAG: tRNA CCA-pyrophosphorylase [Candidatus Altarchaeum sp. CG12_big_fil_rev_8_21_14_0_65_33_22]PIV28756.1 MAG: tRNA CCA-pyrophosphorylase [Candidatus Altarchaeum sp. CG03_land_8_20_14_0_80_32_618]PIX48276.1 MAG: tRNA CCA-pyrophosphorylase [Candidatus Altarchaeum sp. CG_4_8_14_3_um_filter_33_2054]PIZ29678.1 MAG: tRNA CCA-pyrophosphorylase [Candidatus Altarchaeum sp. CG_4_10_14_0_8_um_filter_32_851]PJC15971.1 MAG: tRNA